MIVFRTTVASVLALLLQGQFFQMCAVVGSSGSVLNLNSGLEIDSYDAVFRFNDAPTKVPDAAHNLRVHWKVSGSDALSILSCHGWHCRMFGSVKLTFE